MYFHTNPCFVLSCQLVLFFLLVSFSLRYNFFFFAVLRYYDLIPFDSSFAAFRYNNLLNNMCRDKGCRFADPTDDLFDYQKGQVYSFFNSDPAEMHCNLRPFFFWHRALLNAASDELQWCHSTTST